MDGSEIDGSEIGLSFRVSQLGGLAEPWHEFGRVFPLGQKTGGDMTDGLRISFLSKRHEQAKSLFVRLRNPFSQRIALTQARLGHRIAQFGGLLEISDGLRHGLFNAPSLAVTNSQHVESGGVVLLCSCAQPPQGLGHIARHPLAFEVAAAEARLGRGVTSLRARPKIGDIRRRDGRNVGGIHIGRAGKERKHGRKGRKRIS